jgi:flagellar basal-body rod modification protein FlgD
LIGMSTTPIGSSTSTGGTTNPYSSLKTEDFVNMMVTQLQNQDPMDPVKNQDLLAQMSQIGQLQSATQLQDTLKSMMFQSQLSSAGSLIGKNVIGTAVDGKTLISGTVNSVQVSNGNVNLELDNGLEMPLANVASIEGQAATAAGATTTVPVAAK